KRAYCLKTQPATGETYPKSDLFNKALMKYWMPDIEVIRPLSVRQQLTEDIQSALKRYTQPSNAP
ncbi:hypothetical protein OFC21_18900, partial [Escherichia coli]|nr:hypothetical protein [Escherichia coli]